MIWFPYYKSFGFRILVLTIGKLVVISAFLFTTLDGNRTTMLDPNSHPGKKPNRLIHEKSPYLLQHAYNPVDWYPWGREAFEKARWEDKPIFLSIGYSTCYWCHVMEREVFENDSLAGLMNKYVVSIKLDREERPDIDRVYMTALQAMSGSCGWPMSMFLTPNLKPFYGATYIPPTSQYGRTGFGDIIEHIHNVWSNDRERIEQISQQLGNLLLQATNPETKPTGVDEQTLQNGYESFLKNYDSTNAGFGGAPKFPRPAAYNFLLRHYKRFAKQPALEMVLETLKRMATSGMYDHIGGGFHRYATDERWHVPHFEKMLYDQAQLAISYLEAFQSTHDEFYCDVARDILEYVLRRMAHPDGGFYSAEDAESLPAPTAPKKEEGAFYVWTKNEIDNILTVEESKIFCSHFGIEEHGNVIADPHGVFRGKNILHTVHTLEETAKQFESSIEQVKAMLASARKKLSAAQAERPRPHLDDKILVSWNGLMISAFARGYQVWREARYLDAARNAASFIVQRLGDESSGQLLRRYRDGEARFEAHLEDYALLVQALIDLYEASFEIRWLTAALTFTKRQNELFYDDERGGFFDTSGHDSAVLVRTKEWYDGAEPTGNSIAILNLLRLAQMTNNSEYDAMARTSLSFFGSHLAEAPYAAPQFLVALDFSLAKPKQIIIAGRADDPHTKELLKITHSSFIPNKILLLADGDQGQQTLASLIPFLNSIHPIDGKPTAYVCENYACQLPTNEPQQFAELLSR